MSPDERRIVIDYLRTQRLAVVSTASAVGAPQAALVGVAVTDALEIVFDTVSTSRKHKNMLVGRMGVVAARGQT